MKSKLFIGGEGVGGGDCAVKKCLGLKYANRHGLIAGATGTVETVTFHILA